MSEIENYYIQIRKKHGYSRDKASELMDTISPEKLEKIENGKQEANPADIMEMADAYQEPAIRNYYCAHDCPMGKFFVPEIKLKELEVTVLHMLSSLNSMNAMKERLIDISKDGRIDDHEIGDFVRMQKELERITLAADSMMLWTETMMNMGAINMEKYNELIESYEEE